MDIGNVHINAPFVALAPMEDITDISFRKICKKQGVSMVYTEFVASEAIVRDVEKSMKKMQFEEEERPIGIQIFGTTEKALVEAAKRAEALGADIVDINFGCPVKKVASKGAGSGILKIPEKMYSLTAAVVNAINIPVTVKTRIGYDDQSKNIVQIAENLQDIGISALTIHGRTKAQMYKGSADWTYIAAVKNNQRMHIPIIGNGDIDSAEKAKFCIDEYGVDGIMIGRAAIGNPWIFNQVKRYLVSGEKVLPPSIEERCNICQEHLNTAIEVKGEKRAIFEMRKHYGAYFKGLPGIKEYRINLLTAEKKGVLNTLLHEIRKKYSTA